MNDGDGHGAYEVLARRRRPQDFDGLVGQSAMVRVLTNAFARGRVPHAIMLTGVRGVGKTSTARIIAKGLNCEASTSPTVKPCGVCKSCVQIAESRHVDVMEMDAASRTGIDDIREIIESVRYRASESRFKVYIIDEVHMLSKNAFNGLLKTLEEPPEHVKFVLATTDIHKVPVTVLSRCMRFDLRRVPADVMVAHLGRVAEAEGVAAEPEALALLARVSEGSVRDALSLMDQAIAHAGGDGESGAIALRAAELRSMLGLAGRDRAALVFEQVLRGDAAAALESLGELYRNGADPTAILRDLAEICHLATLAKAAPIRLEDPALAPADREAAERLGAALSMRVLARAWQMLLKAIEEAARAPSPLAAAEMALIRMAYLSDLPSPDEAIRRLGGEGGPAVGSPAGAAGPAAPSGPRAFDASAPNAVAAPGPRLAVVGGGGRPAPMPAPVPEPAPALRAEAPSIEAESDDGPRTFDALRALLERSRDLKLVVEVETFVRPGPIAPGRFEFTPTPGAPDRLAATLGEKLTRLTGRRWIVSVADGHTAATVAETKAAGVEGLRAEALNHRLVQAVFAAFPEAELLKVADLATIAATEAAPPPPDDDDLIDDGYEPLMWTPDGKAP